MEQELKRETGYFWVKVGINTSSWRIAYWAEDHGGRWAWIAGTQGYDGSMKSVVEINENRITSPDHKVPPLCLDSLISEENTIEEIQAFADSHPNIYNAFFKLYRHNE